MSSKQRETVQRAISVIVPMLNEAASIETTLAPLQPFRGDRLEVVVVDGSSTDDSVMRARPFADQVTTSPRGRACQMNAGASAARHHLLLFLHADTRLPGNGLELLSERLTSSSSFWGRFDVRFDDARGLMPFVAWMMNWRSRLTGVATGDQAMFVTRDLFAAVGGFPEIELMEDIEMSVALKRQAIPWCVRQTVTTSARRWHKHGQLRTIALMWFLRGAYALGASPAWLKARYRDLRGPGNTEAGE